MSIVRALNQNSLPTFLEFFPTTNAIISELLQLFFAISSLYSEITCIKKLSKISKRSFKTLVLVCNMRQNLALLNGL